MKKKIAIIHDRMNLGGTEKALITMLKFLDYKKLDVTLWLMDGTGLLQQEIDPHVSVRYYSNDAFDGKGLLAYYLKSFQFGRLIRSMRYRKKSRDSINQFEDNLKYHIYSLPLITDEVYDCVIVYQGLYMQLLATTAGRFKAKKKAAWIHMKFRHTPEQIASFKEEYALFDRIFCVSDDLKKHFISHYGMEEKTETLYNLFDKEQIRSLAEEPVECLGEDKTILCTVGRISPEKGQMMIPDIAHCLKKDGFDFVWQILGDGQQRQELEDRIKNGGLEKNVILTGNKVNPYPYIKNCSIYVQTSLSEGFCTSTMEAKILGKPVVTTNVAGMKEQFTDGYDALVADSFEPQDIAGKLEQLMESEAMRKEFSVNTLLSLETLDMDSADRICKYLCA